MTGREARDVRNRNRPFEAVTARLAPASAAGVVAAVGWYSADYLSPTPLRYVSVALFGLVVYFVLLTLFPHDNPRATCAQTLFGCFTLEFLKLTDLPHAMKEEAPFWAEVLGTNFNVLHLAAYGVGVGAGVAVHHAAHVRRGRDAA